MEQATKGASDATKQMIKNANGNTIALDKMTLGAKAASVGLKALSIAGNMLIFTAITTGISLLTKAIDDYIHRTEIMLEKAEEAKSNIQDTNAQFESHKKIVDECASTYEKLSKGVDTLSNKNISLSDDDYEEYLRVTNELAEAFPQLRVTVDENGNSIIQFSDKTKTATENLKNFLEQEKQTANYKIAQSLPDLFGGVVAKKDELGKAKNALNELNQEMESFNRLSSGVTKGKNIFSGTGDYSNIYNTLVIALDKYRNSLIETGKVMDASLNPELLINAQQNTNGEYKIEFDTSGIEDIDKLSEYIADAFQDIDETVTDSLGDARTAFNNAQAEFDTAWVDFRANLINAMQSKASYQGLDTASKQLAEALVGNLPSEIAAQMDDDDPYKWISDNIISQLRNIEDPSIKEEFQSKIQELLSFEEGDLNIVSFAEELQRWLDANGIYIDLTPIIKDEQEAKTVLQKSINNIAGTNGATFGDKNIDDRKKLEEYTKNFTEAERQHWLTVTNGIIGADNAINTYEESLANANVNETDILSFSDAWEQLKNSTEDATKGLADELTKLAEAGQLTADALSKADTSEFFKKAGITAEEATNQINALISASTQLQSMSAQISKMSDMLADKKKGNAASASDLAGFDATVKGLESWEEFERVMGSSKSSMEECQAAANALATEWVNNGNYLANLTEENKDYYITQLDNMGIENAEAIVKDALVRITQTQAMEEEFLAQKKAETSDATYSLINATADEITKFAEEKEYADNVTNALIELALKKQLVNGTTLDFSGDLVNISNYVKALGGTADAIGLLNRIKKGEVYMPGDAMASVIASAQAEIDSALVSGTKTNVQVTPTGSSGYKGSSSKSGGSNSKTTIDWIQRKLDVLQKKIDQTKAKFENLFTLKDKKNNLNEQIKLTQKLLAATEKSADRYLKAANKVGLSKSLKKKVKNGSYDINDYSSETAEKIQKYEEYYDRYKDLKKQADELETDIRSLRIDRQQLYVDQAEAKIAKSQAYAELDSGNYKEQNKHLEAQKKYIKEQYKALIQIAKLKGDTLEVDRLRAEKQKELNDLTKQEFDNISNTYDNKIGLNNNKIQAFQDQISLLEARGQQVGSALYTKQMSLNNVNEEKLIAERAKLIQKLAEIPKGKDSWFEAQDKLFSVESELVNIQIENANLQNSINQLKFDRFDNLLDKLNDVVDETNFLKDMLSDNLFDDNGMITDDGITAMGLTAQNYDVYLAEAEKYKQMLSDVKDMYDAGKISLEEYEGYQRTYSQGQRDAIKSANDAKKAVIDYVKQGLDAQNDALAEAIEKQKELLESEKDLKSFQDQLADSNKTIADIQKQINALESDNSEENRKKLQQLKADLADAQKDQEDLLYDRSISDQEDALDQMLKNSQEQAENYLKDSEKVFVDALDYVNAHTYQVSQNLEKISKDTGYDISSNITNAWKDGGKAVDNYANILQGNIPNITAQIGLITSAWEATAKAAEDAAASMVKATRSNYLDYTSIGADKNGSSSSQSNQLNTGSGTSSVLGAASPVTGNILGGVLTGMQMANKTAIASFISNNKKDPVQGTKYASLNQYLLKNYGGVLSKSDEARLADMLGVKISSRALTGEQGKTDLAKILAALKNIGFATGGIIDPKDILKRTGEKGYIIANPHEAVLTEPQWESIRDLGTTLTNLNQPLYKPYIPEFQARNAQSPVYNIDNRVTVEGVATDKIVKDFENVATKQAEKVVSKINNITYAKGVRR